jgi:hypothetical protein
MQEVVKSAMMAVAEEIVSTAADVISSVCNRAGMYRRHAKLAAPGSYRIPYRHPQLYFSGY